ncbi:MAG: hypothetical protein RLP44_31800 [Aggregatilineales bacterium]
MLFKTTKILLTVAGSLIAILMLAACQGPPPTQYLLEVTREVTVVVMVTPTPEGDLGAQSVETTETPDTEIAVSSTATEAAPLPTATQAATSDSALPGPIINSVIVAEQRFENGRLFYLQPSDEIWVLENGADNTGGTWSVYDDNWEEGQPEFDPNIEPPEGLYQPERGFGKLWRENTQVGDAVGWALEPEVGHVTTYTYVYGGEVNSNNVYVQGPGYHTIDSWYGGTYVFNEADNTWRLEPEEGE